MYALTKRFMDIIVSILLIVLFFPFGVIIATIIKLEDGGPVFFGQSRMGISGKSIRIIKFRSMRTGSDNIESSLSPSERELYYKEYKLLRDPRTTKIGTFIRKSCLDEIPQLINALSGDLSIVGPRPIVKDEASFYSSDQLQQLLSVKPGITGYWQTFGRNTASYSDGTRQQYELYYVKNKSIKLDIQIIVKTVIIILTEIFK